MRYDHYKRVVQWDRRHRFPNRKSLNHVPKVKKVTRVWSLIGVGFQPQYVPAAWTALERMTGQKPVILNTKKSVAQRRLKEGDPVGCMVTVTGKSAYDRREHWSVRVFPEVRPFSGFEVRKGSGAKSEEENREGRKERTTTGIVDERGQFTFHMEQPGVIPARASYYESYFQLVAGSSGNQVGGRYLSVHTTAKSNEEGVGLMQGRRFPIA